MSTLLLAIVTVLYAGQSIVCLFTQQTAMAWVFIGYSVANVALIVSMK